MQTNNNEAIVTIYNPKTKKTITEKWELIKGHWELKHNKAQKEKN